MRASSGWLVAVVVLAGAAPAEAQLGDLLRKGRDAVERTLKRPPQPQPSEVPAAPSRYWRPPVNTESKARLNRNYQKTIVQGAVIGGVIGGGLTAILGGDEKAVAIGAVGGAGIGGLIGKSYADKFESMAKSKDRTEQQIAALEANKLALDQSLTATEQNIAYIRTQIVAMRAQLRRGAIREVDLQAFRADALKELEDARTTLDRANVTYTEAQQTLARVKIAAKPEVRALQPRAEQALASLSMTQRKASAMRGDVTSTINALG